MTSHSDNGGPAFPAMHFDMAENEHGMTLRDYFAAKAMQGMLASGWCADVRELMPPQGNREVAIDAYLMADAMLKARQQ